MSKPPPINPLPTLPSTTTSILSNPTTSRPNTDERSSLPPAQESTRQDPPSSPPPSLPPVTPDAGPSRTAHTHARGDSPQVGRRMAKRLRRESSADVQDHSDIRSSPSTDSQDGMADNEMDAGQEQQLEQSEELAPTTAPPKKKRTRTLTTPHQSAVLHALLAKSRFPTTAVREEVGRSIGLSARKVQIWFQNQRQKARRPRSQGGDASRSRAPQYGPFPSHPEPSSTASTSSAIDSSSITLLPPGSHQSLEGYSSSVETPSRLLGPGMPGIDPYASSVFRTRPHTAASSVNQLHQDVQPYASIHLSSGSRMHTPPRGFATPSTRPPSSQGPSSRFSRTLPPLNFSGPTQPGYSGPRPVSRHTSLTLSLSSIPPDAHRPPSPDVTFAYRVQDPSPPNNSSLNIPPPFTLQPQPQWDNSILNAVPRPTSSGWSRPGSRLTRDGSPPPHGLRRDLLPAASTLPPSTSLLFSTPPQEPRIRAETTPPRTGRYDPIRSTLFSHSPTKPSTSSPEQSPRNDSERLE
ncbi:homeobox-domain-containing protein [Pluteus cervinus]|uniref:Homeobox-domain-containing protein n=1 Tax=Pluteus cervinus TaxID=181527 RepID=A0ACD3B2M7_9AGAR|nr:homeobox-domain-containing protein [Pluteus cervinus]